MIFSVELPDELAGRLAALLPEEERDGFAIAAIADALEARQREIEADERVLAALRADLDPEREPERDAAECVAAVEEALADVEAERNLVSFEEACRRWDAEKAARRADRA